VCLLCLFVLYCASTRSLISNTISVCLFFGSDLFFIDMLRCLNGSEDHFHRSPGGCHRS
jgi:hypothetical protein